jgi:hypothetical protein
MTTTTNRTIVQLNCPPWCRSHEQQDAGDGINVEHVSALPERRTRDPGRPPPILLSRRASNHPTPRPGISRWKAYFFRLGQIYLWGRRRTAS